MSVLNAVRRRRSHAKVTPAVPSRAELLPLIEAAGGVPDHGALRPWRIIEIRGEARARVGAAFAEAVGPEHGPKLAGKPMRAELLLAVVAVIKPSIKVPAWEQEATAAGVAHLLALLLDEADWGVMWRSGPHTDADPVRAAHGLAPNERLLGWLYVGGVPEGAKDGAKLAIDPEEFLTAI